MRILFYIFLALVVVGLFFLQGWVGSRSFADAKLDKLSSFQEKQFELFKEVNSLLITLATAVIGAVGAFVLDRDKAGPLSTAQKVRAFLSIVLAGSSIYCGYLSHETVGWMLQNQIFNLDNPRVMWSERFQMWGFILSIILLADFFYGALRSRPAVGGGGHAASVLTIFAVATGMLGMPPGSVAQARQDKMITIQENLHISAEVSTVIARWQQTTGGHPYLEGIDLEAPGGGTVYRCGECGFKTQRQEACKTA